MATEMIYLAVAALLAPALAEIAKIRARAHRAFTFMAVGGVLFVLSAAFSVVSIPGLEVLAQVSSIVSLIALVVVTVGAVVATATLLRE